MDANQVIDRCESTNDLARSLGESGYPHGTWISARVQDKGRGRLGREWVSSEGNLYLSYIARIEPKSCWTWVPLLAALAVADAVQEVSPSNPIAIKWPNDLWIKTAQGWAKVGGVLCEAQGTSRGSFIVIGIGLNCASAPADLDQPATSLASCSADLVRPAVVRALNVRLAGLAGNPAQAISAIRVDYDARAALAPGTVIEWSTLTGRVLGLGESGELRVLGADGDETRLYAEDVRIRIAR